MEDKNENRFLEVIPSKIQFHRTTEGACPEADLDVSNITNKCVVFKVFINRTSTYSSVPAIGYLNPGEKTNIKIKKVMI